MKLSFIIKSESKYFVSFPFASILHQLTTRQIWGPQLVAVNDYYTILLSATHVVILFSNVKLIRVQVHVFFLNTRVIRKACTHLSSNNKSNFKIAPIYWVYNIGRVPRTRGFAHIVSFITLKTSIHVLLFPSYPPSPPKHHTYNFTYKNTTAQRLKTCPQRQLLSSKELTQTGFLWLGRLCFPHLYIS